MNVASFFKLPQEEIQEVFLKLKYIKKSNKYLGFTLNPLMTYEYQKVYNIHELYFKGNIVMAIKELIDVPVKKIYQSNYKEFIYFVSLVYSYLEQINVLNKRLNEVVSDFDNNDDSLKEAGVDVLSKYGVFGIIDELANGDLTKHAYIESLPYEVVFTKLLRDKEKQVVKTNYEHILKERSKK